ncbi:MAG: hypothetical protein RL318_305 [Fibrobacterota bacterium]|jgi:hypothetical protein
MFKLPCALALCLGCQILAEAPPEAIWVADLNSRGFESYVHAKIGFDRHFAPISLEEDGALEGNQWTVRIAFSKGKLIESFRRDDHSEGSETTFLRGCRLSGEDEAKFKTLPKRSCDSLVLATRKTLEKWEQSLIEAIQGQIPDDSTSEEITFGQSVSPNIDPDDEQATAQGMVQASAWNTSLPRALWLHLRRKTR